MNTCLLHILYILVLSVFALTANAQSRYAAHSKLASGKWVKIRVKDEGVYQLSKNTLKNMGFSDPAKVSLYGYNLPMLPEACIENLPDDVTELPLYRRSDGSLLFYSCGTTEWKINSDGTYSHKNNPYTKYIYYLLTEQDKPAEWKTKENAIGTYVQTTYLAHTLVEDDTYSFINCGRTFFENYDYANGSARNYKLSFENAACGDVKLEVKFGAAGSNSSTLSVSSGTNKIGTINLPKLADNYTYASVASKTFTLYDQTVSSMNITLQHTRDAGISGHLDYILASYDANLTFTKNEFTFSPNKGGVTAFDIKCSDADIAVWNVTNPASTCEYKGTASGTSYKVGLTGAKQTDRFLVFKPSATYESPEFVGSIANQDLHSLDSINLVIITPASGKLTAQAQRLADIHKAHDGMNCAVIEADKIYNEFSCGTPDATAYRRLMKMIYDKGHTNGTLNLLLFGNCLWDNRMVTSALSSKSPNDYLLVYESDNSWSHTESYPLEEYYALLADGKGISPLKETLDCGVGRLPVTNVSEAKGVVDKLINYINNSEAGAWKNTICFLGDDGNDNIHMKDAENVLSNTQKLFPDYYYKRIYWDCYPLQQSSTGNSYPDAYAEINKTVQEGALIMNYTGHGSAYCLAHEQVLKTADFQNWTSPRLPLWLTAACDIAPFDMNTENITCEAVVNKQGGAMGFIGTARTVYSSPNRVINRNFMSHVLSKKDNGTNYTIGEALSMAKSDIVRSTSVLSKTDSINKVQYVLIGDPAIKIATPTHKVIIDKLNGKAIDKNNLPKISAGETVIIEGHITDAEGKDATGYNGFISPTIFDNEEHIVCKNNAGDNVKPFEYDDHTRIIYSGTDSIKAGKFTFSFPVPLDINYSDEQGLIYLYAVNGDKTQEANGIFKDFLVGGSDIEEKTDTVGPRIALFVNGEEASNGNIVTDEDPIITVELYDDSGINTTGSGLGHDLVAIIDNNEATTYTLNSYYTHDIGNFRTGTIKYNIKGLSSGVHTIVIRAFDTLNNMGQFVGKFEVVEGLEKEIKYYDMAGRLVSNRALVSLPKGIYIQQTNLKSVKGIVSTKSKKIIVTQ